MLNVICSTKPETGETWKFHWDGKTKTPFTQAEMDADRAEWRETVEKIAARVFADGFEN